MDTSVIIVIVAVVVAIIAWRLVIGGANSTPSNIDVTQIPAEILNEPRFRHAITRRNTIGAIKIYRELSGVDLRTAKDTVEHLLKNPTNVMTSAPTPEMLDDYDKVYTVMADSRFRHAILRKNKIEAIKIYRELSGSDLRTAKDIVGSIFDNSTTPDD